MLLDAEVIPNALDRLLPEHFSERRHSQIFAALSRLADKGRSTDMVTLVETLRDDALLDSVGGASYLSDVLGSVATSAHIRDHIAIVVDRAVKRRVKSECAQVVELADSACSAAELVDDAQQRMFSVWSERGTPDIVSVNDTMKPLYEHIQVLMTGGSDLTGVTSGYKGIDKLLAGFQPGDLTVLAARPSMGKTALALNMAVHAAKAGTPVLFFSLEMTKEQLGIRLLAQESGIDGSHIRVGNVGDWELPDFNKAVASVSQLPLSIVDGNATRPSTIRSLTRRAVATEGVGLVMIDYIQQLSPDTRREQSKNDEVGCITIALKQMAKSLKLPVVLLAQLNRKLEYRENKRPHLSDLRDSGRIEEDADVVMFVYRAGWYLKHAGKEDDTNGKAEISIAKNRNGPCGIVNLKFDGPTTSFTKWEEPF
jgi:replicative DNA helicase